MLLEVARSQVLIVDVQERLLPAMHEADALIARCAVLLQAAATMRVPVLMSEQYRKGLGVTAARLLDLRGDASVLEKMHFSCAEDPAMAAHVRSLATQGRDQLLIAGIESHVCVLQSALGFKAAGLDVYVVADAMTSRRPESIALAQWRLRGAGISLVNTEMVAFEWLRICAAAEFKTVSRLIK